MANRTEGMVSPNRAKGSQYPPMVREGSLCSLNYDEVQSQLGNTGKPLHNSANDLDEDQKDVISAESGQLVQNPSSENSFIFGNIGLNGTVITNNKKNISEVWTAIAHQEHFNRSMDTQMQHPSLGETTLESFLAHAGIGDIQPMMGIDPTVMMPSEQENWLQMQIPAINIQQQQHQPSRIIGLCPDFSVSKSVYENPVMEIGYLENSMAISSSMSPACSESKGDVVSGKNKTYKDEVLEKNIEKRQKRMAKNRESAARSRAKKQVSSKRFSSMRLVKDIFNRRI
ncbi:hypothetical protein RJT34_12144 [Clitoria ternatea]|uniref:BZIP domain-containing protein n=1 Tax=Clitoria ternatea TaxID=43366 RepID=A0AAN9JLL8_CLITE